MSVNLFPENPITGQQVTPSPTATISVGVVDFGNEPSKFTVPTTGQGIFTDYKVFSMYENPFHRYMLGITDPDGFQGESAAFVQLAAPTLLWVCKWTACRYHSQPIIPDPTSRDPNWVLLDKAYSPAMVTVGADGVSPLYRISGRYVYGHKKPNDDVLRNVSYPRPPWLEDVFDRSTPANTLDGNLLESSAAVNNAQLNFAVAP
jgi:hypothetical protein